MKINGLYFIINQYLFTDLSLKARLLPKKVVELFPDLKELEKSAEQAAELYRTDKSLTGFHEDDLHDYK